MHAHNGGRSTPKAQLSFLLSAAILENEEMELCSLSQIRKLKITKTLRILKFTSPTSSFYRWENLNLKREKDILKVISKSPKFFHLMTSDPYGRRYGIHTYKVRASFYN